MISYFCWSLAGCILLLCFLTFLVGSTWVFTIALKELLNEWGIEWKSIGATVQPKRKLKSSK